MKNFKVIWSPWFSKDNLQFFCFDIFTPSLALSPAAIPSLPQSFYSCMCQSIWSCFHLHNDAYAQGFMLPSLLYASITAFMHLFLWQFVSELQFLLPLFQMWCFYPCISTSTQFWWLPVFCDLSILAVMVPFMPWPSIPFIDDCIPASIFLSLIWPFSPCFDATLSSLLFQSFLICYCSC